MVLIGSGDRDGWDVVVSTGPQPEDAARIRVLDGPAPGVTGDLVVTALLLPAMRSGRDLEVPDPVSAVLLDGTDRVQDLFLTWDRFLRPAMRWYHRIDVRAPARTTAAPRASGVLCLFTGGVDSFHTVLTERHRIDALLYVHGFDVRLEDRDLRDRVRAHLRAAALELDLPLIEVESDLQEFGTRWGVPWDDFHGAALAAVAGVFSQEFGRLLVPATHSYAHLEGLGSHPLLDPSWSGNRLAVEHVGAAATRVDKLRVLAGSPTARRHLRVCWENRDGRYNCGRCEKCIRTGVAVRLAGAEGRFPTIPAPSLRDVASVEVTGRGSAWQELRNELVEQGAVPRLRRVIDLALARHQLRRWRFTRRITP